jgi:hypothetical protein
MRETSNTLSKQNSQQPKQFRGGEKKVMKKSLSLLVAIAMVFSMFATVVSAAGPEEGQSAGQYLNQLGVIKGNGTDLKEGQTWKRQDIVVLLSRLLGVEAAAKATAKSHEFKDVTDKNYDGYISWAVEEGLVQGKGNGKFGYGDELKTQEFYALVLRAFKVEVAYDEVPAKAVEMKLAAEGTDFAAIPTRGATYSTIVTALNTEVPGTGKTLGEALGLIEGAAVSATQTGSKFVTVKFNKAVDTDKVKFAVKNGITTREVVKATFSEDKKSAILEFATKLVDGASTVTVSGIGDKDLVADFTAATEKIKDIVFTSDKLALGTDANNAVNYKSVSVGYKIVNQFDEDVTKNSGGSLQFTAGKADTTASAVNGVLKLTSGTTNFQINESVFVSAVLNLGNYGITANKTFTVGQQAIVDTVEILSVYNQDKKELNTSNVEDFLLLVDAKDQYGNDVTLQQFKYGVFATVSNPTLFTVDKEKAVANAGPNKDKIGIPLKKSEMAAGFVIEGDNAVTITSLFGAKSDTLSVPVKKAPTLSNIELSTPNTSVTTETKAVKIPFEAYDQNGNKLEKYDDIKNSLILSASNGNGKFQVKQDFLTKKAYLEWDATGTNVNSPATLMATIINTTVNKQLQVRVVAPNDPRAISGLKDVKSTLTIGQSVDIEYKHIVVKDQDDREMKLEDILKSNNGNNGFSVTVSVYDAATYTTEPLAIDASGLNVGTAKLDKDHGKITVKALKKGSATVKVTLNKTTTTNGVDSVVAIASYNSFSINVVDPKDAVSDDYQVAKIEKLYAGETANGDVKRGAEVKVFGKMSNGTELTLDKSRYTVTVPSGLRYDYASNKIVAVGDQFSTGTETSKTVKYTVVSLDTDRAYDGEVTLVKEAPKATTIELQSKDNLGVKHEDGVLKVTDASKALLPNILASLKIKDQYGAELDNSSLAFQTGAFTATITNDNANVSFTNGEIGNGATVSVIDSTKEAHYTVTIASKDGSARATFKVVFVK